MSEKEKSIKFEECVLCHSQTGVAVSSPVAEREYYVSGIGQLCGKCFGAVIKTSDGKEHITDSQVNSIMRLCLQDEDEKGYKRPSAYIKK